MRSAVNILFASTEVAPYASTGGLGEVAGALPRALAGAGARVACVMPMYRSILEGAAPAHDTGLRLRIPLGFTAHTGEVWAASDDTGPTVYFIRRDEFFDRRGIYGIDGRDYDDNLVRFIFFQKAVVALIDAMGLSPEVVHAHDWSTGLVPLFLRHGPRGTGRKAAERCVFTIHNLAYQGVFSGSHFPVTNLPYSCFSIETMEFYGKINCMKAGLTTADRVSTVSEAYAQEILTPAHGCGLDGVLRDLGPRLSGIPNGIDTAAWNPATDPLLTHRFSASRLAGRARGRAALAEELGLDIPDKAPLIGMISRLVDQKGLDILVEAMPRIMEDGAAFVLLGTGERKYEALARQWMARWPRRFRAQIAFDTVFAHRIQAGADIHLMPSRFEPCGLGQLYALRYGALPVVNPTGGLDDTIQALSADGRIGNGIRMREYSAEAMVEAVREAVRWIGNAKRWPAIQRRLMSEDHSWAHSAKRYMALYADALGDSKPVV